MALIRIRPARELEQKTSAAFELHRELVLALLPDAEVEHVGSTAVPGALTKGDLDLVVRVDQDAFPTAIAILRSHYAVHQPKNWTQTLASFKDLTSRQPEVGVQLVVAGSPDDRLFGPFRDALICDPALLEQYNELKRGLDGADYERYTEHKGKFIERVLGEIRCVSWDDAEMVADQITGTLAAAVTPLRDGGERLDEDALAALSEFYGASGLDGLLVLGTTGEGILFADAERRRVAELVIAGVETLRVIVNCGGQTTAQTCALAAHAAEAGADAVAVIGPPYFGLDERELLEHFTAAAAACAPLPFYLYEYADRTGYAIPPAVVEESRRRVPNLVGMKVSDSPFERVKPYLALGLNVFIGAEALLLEGLDHGAVGAVSGVAAAFPEAVSALVREPTAERAALVGALRSALSKHTLQASVKAALGLRGLPVRPDVRAPLRPLTATGTQQLRSDLQAALGATGTALPVRS